MASAKKFYTDFFSYYKNHPNYFSNLDFTRKTAVFTRLEPKTHTKDYQKALSFEAFDPYWSLARQWQFGRFDGNDCGTPVSVKVKTVRRKFDQVCLRNENGDLEKISYSTEVPLEYEVEKTNVDITPYIRIQSAMQLKKKLRRKFDLADFSKIHEWLLNKFCSEKFNTHTDDNNPIEDLKIKNNPALKDFSAAYYKRTFDGYELYKKTEYQKFELERELKETFPSLASKLMKILGEYVIWFDSKYFPTKYTDSAWSNKKLGYQVEIYQGTTKYEAEDYDNGRLSWYSFDNKDLNSVKRIKRTDSVSRNYSSGYGMNFPREGNILNSIIGGSNISSGAIIEKNYPENETEKLFTYIPVPANFAGAPSQRLWEFENTKVNMIADNEQDFSMLATAAIMQYISMYSNDWMIIPLETETGVVLDVEGVVIKDSFGELLYMEEDAEDVDGNKDSDEFTDRWNLFGTASTQAFAKDNFTTARGLLFPPVVERTEESSPIEEVQFLRDEMANMVWGVETKINDGCGGTMDGKTLSDAVFRDIDEKNAPNEEVSAKEPATANKTEAEYSLLIQNRVPMNWIPFLPQQLQDGRNICFRRGRMPLFYNNEFLSVRPSTKLLAAEKDRNKNVKPFYIDENQIAGYGTKLVKTAQRTRWFLGKTFNWTGNRTTISNYQANSGLLFDELIPTKKTRKTIELSDGKENLED